MPHGNGSVLTRSTTTFGIAATVGRVRLEYFAGERLTHFLRFSGLVLPYYAPGIRIIIGRSSLRLQAGANLASSFDSHPFEFSLKAETP